MSFPVFVTRMRLANPLRVLILGTGDRLLRSGNGRCTLTARRKAHENVLSFQHWLSLHNREWALIATHTFEDPSPDVLVDHFATSEHDRHFHLLAGFEELLQTLELGLEIVLGHLRPKLHLLELDDVLLAPLVLLPLDGLELVASVIHEPADGRACLWRHLDEVESFLACDAQSGVQR